MSLLIFSEISALASSISSRMSRDARSEMSWTAAAICGEESSRSGAKALDQEGEGDSTQDRRPDEALGGRTALRRLAAEVLGRRRREDRVEVGLPVAGGGGL